MSRSLNFAAALKSFLGHLEGTHKAQNTISNYRLDLLSFERFLNEAKRGRSKGLGDRLQDLDFKQIEDFHSYLKTQGLKTNSRRRKLLTVRKFLGYLSRRKKVPQELDRKVPAPQKIERVPLTVSTPELIEKIRALPTETELDARNRVLLWTLAETGMLVSEARKLKFEQFQSSESGSAVCHIEGKTGRKLVVSAALLEAIRELEGRAKKADSWMFFGFNRFGPMEGVITARGVELLVRAYADKLATSEEVAALITPRTFRHSAVLHWWREGVKRDEIQKRLGLKTAYAFRVYEPLFKSTKPATSTCERNPPGCGARPELERNR